MHNLFCFVYPGKIGGAASELRHSIKLWIEHGCRVTVVVTWATTQHWRDYYADLGCEVISPNPHRMEFPAGSICISFCNSRFLPWLGKLREQGCRTVWAPCMTYFGDGERHTFRRAVPDAWVFQSCYQMAEHRKHLDRLDVPANRCHLIHGAFDPSEFPFRPRPHETDNGDPFVVGRLSRADYTKFSPKTWDLYRRIPRARPRVLGWSPEIGAHIGHPPDGAEVLPPGRETPQAFLASLHCLVQASGRAVENWPRYVLEAFSAGVPVVTDNRGGLPEMIRHGETGFLCDSTEQMVEIATELAEDEPGRLEIARAAYYSLEEIADPDAIWAAWERLFGSLGA